MGDGANRSGGFQFGNVGGNVKIEAGGNIVAGDNATTFATPPALASEGNVSNFSAS
jgi:hypothetical protein